MKKFISSIIGILAFTSIGMCYATTYYFDVLNQTDIDLWFTFHTDDETRDYTTHLTAEPSEYVPKITSGKPGGMSISVTPPDCGSVDSVYEDCPTSGYIQFSVKSKGNPDNNCSIDFKYDVNALYHYNLQPNNQHGVDVYCYATPGKIANHWTVYLEPPK